MTEAMGERFARAVADKDEAALRGLLHPEVDFEGLTPGRHWHSNTAAELVETIFGTWFSDHDRIDALEAVETGSVIDRDRFSYRVRITNADGQYLVEQQAYVEVEDDRITWLRILCSGYRPFSAAPDA